jgi:hypothetical protein
MLSKMTGKCVAALAVLCIAGCSRSPNAVSATNIETVQAGSIGGIFSCSYEPKLKSLGGTPPIKMQFLNQSGDTVNLYWLNPDGHRVSYGSIDNNAAKGVLTFITHPWVIADKSDRCLEIALPGEKTQVVAIQPS